MGTTIPIDPKLIANARELRTRATDAEQLMWMLLRNRRMGGLKFRRQHPLGPYILDFYCASEKISVELDGHQHGTDEKRRYDERRTKLLRDLGVRELRFSNQEVLQQTETVLGHIWRTLFAPSPARGSGSA